MRKIIAYKNYFLDFVKTLSKEEEDRMRRALDLLKTEYKIPSHYIKYVRDGVYELRVTCKSVEFRVFFIYDGNTVVVLFNAFRKKSQKLPNSEVKKAIRLKQEYYESKRNQ